MHFKVTALLSALLSFSPLSQWATPVGAPLARAETGTGAASPAPQASLPVPERLRKNVDFWIRIYSQYDTSQGVLHDSKYIDRVYEVINFGSEDRRHQGRIVREAKERWRKVLLSLHRKQKEKNLLLTEDERKVQELFKDLNNPDKYQEAANRKRLRFQLGQKNRYFDGLKQSGQYLARMEEVFKREGLPVELTRLPFVESSFNLKARSKVGASGIWQFMRSTGRLFMKIDDVVDERNDPIRATEAAARLLKLNYDSLGNWPLAVTAYNHGRKGLMRAVLHVGSDRLDDIVENYRGRAFGFASGNFYSCLLAAVEIERDPEKYFGKVERAAPMDALEAELPVSIRLKDVAQLLSLDLKTIRGLNPALSDSVFTGRVFVPAGYRLRLPRKPELTSEAQVRVFLASLEEVPATFKRRDRPYGTRRPVGPMGDEKPRQL